MSPPARELAGPVRVPALELTELAPTPELADPVREVSKELVELVRVTATEPTEAAQLAAEAVASSAGSALAEEQARALLHR